MRESSRRSVCSCWRSSDALQGSAQGCSSPQVASGTGTKIMSSIAKLFEQINYVNAACSLFNKWKIKEAYTAKQTAIKPAASAHVSVHLDTKSLLPRARTVCFSGSSSGKNSGKLVREAVAAAMLLGDILSTKT